MLQVENVNIAHRDELYRTARDVAAFGKLYDNVQAIDEYIFHMVVNGKKFICSRCVNSKIWEKVKHIRSYGFAHQKKLFHMEASVFRPCDENENEIPK